MILPNQMSWAMKMQAFHDLLRVNALSQSCPLTAVTLSEHEILRAVSQPSKKIKAKLIRTKV